VKKIQRSVTLLLATVLAGTLGYHFVEGMAFFDALYMTMITISTVGFQEIAPLSTKGRVVTLFIIATGITIAGYTLGNLLRMFIEGELSKSFGRRKVGRRIAELKDHFIICGCGRIGRLIAQELAANGKDFLVLENNPALVEYLEQEDYLYLALDATTEETLLAAGIKRARGIVTAVGSDADNVFITLTAKGLNPDIYVLARASEEKNEIKLKRAGATRVVSPYMIGGRRMAQVLIKPTVVDFIDIAIMDSTLGLQMEEAVVQPGSSLVGKNLIESNLRKDYGVIIVLIKKTNGEMIFNPTPDEVLDEKDVLVMLGKKDDMVRMHRKII
jgi:voltage-gated potassium channel